MQPTTTAPTIAPERYARLVAENRRLAFEFARLSAAGDTDHARAVVHHAANDILDHCDTMPVITPTGGSSSLFESLKTIEQVAKRSDQRGDEAQASWCILLYQELAGSRGGRAEVGVPASSRSGRVPRR